MSIPVALLVQGPLRIDGVTCYRHDNKVRACKSQRGRKKERQEGEEESSNRFFPERVYGGLNNLFLVLFSRSRKVSYFGLFSRLEDLDDILLMLEVPEEYRERMIGSLEYVVFEAPDVCVG